MDRARSDRPSQYRRHRPVHRFGPGVGMRSDRASWQSQEKRLPPISDQRVDCQRDLACRAKRRASLALVLLFAAE